MHLDHPLPYNLGFTAASLRPELARIIADSYLLERDWQAAKARVLSSNQLQARTRSSAVRLERELRQRLQTLTAEQLSLLAQGGADERTAMAWLSALKSLAFVFDFAADVLREKLALHDGVLRPSDYESFLDKKSGIHPELAELASTSRRKVRQVLLLMLHEAGILTQDKPFPTLHRPFVTPTAFRSIAADDRRWLAGFLVPDAEILAL